MASVNQAIIFNIPTGTNQYHWPPDVIHEEGHITLGLSQPELYNPNRITRKHQ